MDPLYAHAKEIFPNASDDEIMQGLSDVRQQLPQASDDDILSHAMTLKQAQDDGSLMKHMATQDVKNKYGIADRQAIVDQNNKEASGINWQAGLAALGAGLQGQNAMAAGNAVKEQQDAQRRGRLSEFEKQKSQSLADRDDATTQAKLARETDPNSLESKMAQDLAIAMGMNRDQAQGLTAAKFKDFSPVLQKKYEIAQKSLDRSEDRDLKRELLALKQQQQGGKESEGQKALDKDYAKDYNDWTSGGRSILSKNLENLEAARDALKKDSSLTGGLTGVLGDRLTSDKVLKQRQKVQSAVQNSLKATLGAQFTEKEGERILKNAYNEAASPETNIESLDALINQLKTQGANNDAKAKHFQRNGTLTGFQDPNLNKEIKPSSMASGSVRMRDPKGNIRLVPKDQVTAAKQAGGVVVDESVAQMNPEDQNGI